jgi:hypothetical protein
MRTVPSSNIPEPARNYHHFSQLVQSTLETVEAEPTKRDYGQIYGKWYTWCKTNLIHPSDIRPGYVVIFLNEQATTMVIRKRYLVALRKLAQTDYTLNPSNDTRYTFEALQTIKVVPLAHLR